MQTIDVKCNGKSARENRGLSIVRFSLGLHFAQIASCLPCQPYLALSGNKKKPYLACQSTETHLCKEVSSFPDFDVGEPIFEKHFFSFTYVDVGEHIISIRVFLFQILEFWLNHHDQALLVRLNKSWESSICERKSAFRFKRRPNHLFKPQWKKVMAKICSKRAFIYWSFLPLEIFEIIRRIAYFHNLIQFWRFFCCNFKAFFVLFPGNVWNWWGVPRGVLHQLPPTNIQPASVFFSNLSHHLNLGSL